MEQTQATHTPELTPQAQAVNEAIQNKSESTIVEANQYLTFTLAKETYGIDILKVQEIRGWSEETQIPNAPEFIRGVINLRGAIVPVLDMRKRFNMSATDFTQYTVVIVVQVCNRIVGIVVDAVSDVISYQESDIRPAPDFGTSIDASFIKGLAAIKDEMVIMLNIDKMLASCELVQLDKITDSNED